MQNIQTAFQDGCDTIVGGCTTYGSTPTSNSPEDIVKAIHDIAKSAPNYVIVATLIGGKYANGSSNSSHATTTDDTVFTVKDVSDSLSGGRLTALKACSGKLFVVGAQRGGTASATVKINGTTYVSGSAYTNGYKAEISLVPNDYVTISLSKPDTTYAAFGCVLLVTLD